MRVTKWKQLCILILVMTSCGWSQSPSGQTAFAGVSLRAEVSKTEIVCGEPLFVNITMTNQGGNALGYIDFRPYFSEGNDIEVMLQHPGELPYRYESSEEPGVYGSYEYTIPHGQTVRQEFMILYDRKQSNGYAFGKPGEYMMSFSLSHHILREPEILVARIPPTKITVREPTGKDAEAFKIIANKNCARALQRYTGEVDHTTHDALAKVARDYPDSVYGSACFYGTTIKPFAQATPDFQTGADLTHKFLKKYPNDVRYFAAVRNLIFAYDRLNEPDLAREWFYYLKTRDPGNPSLKAEDPLAKKYFHGKQATLSNARWWLYPKPWEAPAEEEAGPAISFE